MPGNANAARATISLAVLLAASTWFSGTAVAPQLQVAWALDDTEAAALTAATQLGFIAGTLLFAFGTIADRFGARQVFLVSALLGAVLNAAFASGLGGYWGALALRFATGVTLAGVYPVGMKLVAAWTAGGLGPWLGVMVGALAAGTGLPFLARAAGAELAWQSVVLGASGAAVAGGLLVWLAVEDGPHLPARSRFDGRAIPRIWDDIPFRWNAFGYFGHMWELYAFWSLQVFYLRAALGWSVAAVAAVAFAVVLAGALGCVAGGVLSRRLGERRVALGALVLSACACAASGFAFVLPPAWLIAFVVAWGVVVVADSPQFSAIAARTAPRDLVGTALALQNGVGFLVTAIAIQCTAAFADSVGWRWALLLLLPGPVLGAWSMIRLGRCGDRTPA